MMYSKPNFLIIGTQKSGTESHTTHLNQHSNVYMYEGECHFFDRGDYQPDYDEYHEFFKDVENEIAIGEKTPSYMYFHFAIDNIYEYNPDMKLIMFLREPISRTYSQYSMDRGNGVNVFHSDDIHFSDDEDSFLGDFIEDKNTIVPGKAAENSNLRETTTRVLSSLTPREERVLRMRFGIGVNSDHTLEEVGQQFTVTRERIRQIEAKALRKLKHPSRSKQLKSFLDKT